MGTSATTWESVSNVTGKYDDGRTSATTRESVSNVKVNMTMVDQVLLHGVSVMSQVNMTMVEQVLLHGKVSVM